MLATDTERAAAADAASRLLDSKLEEQSEGLDDFLSRVDDVASLISAMQSGSLDPKDVKVPTVTKVTQSNRNVINPKAALEATLDDIPHKEKQPRVPTVPSTARAARPPHASGTQSPTTGAVGNIEAKHAPHVRTTTATDYKKWENFADADDDEPDALHQPAAAANIVPSVSVDDSSPASAEQRGFMSSMEADAKDRAQRRERRKKNAIGIKEKGNACFKKGDYQNALKFYSQAIMEANFVAAFYTNRATTYIKLGDHEKALKDCDTCLRLDPDCVKAYLHRATAYHAMVDFEAAQIAYDDAIRICTNQTQRDELHCKCARMQLEARDHAVADQFPVSHPIALLLKQLDEAAEAHTDKTAVLMEIRSAVSRDRSYKTAMRVHGGLGIISRLVRAGVGGADASADSSVLGIVALAVLTSLCNGDKDSAFAVAQDTDLFKSIGSVISKADGNHFLVPTLKLLEEIGGHSDARAAVCRRQAIFDFVVSHVAMGTKPRQSHHLARSFIMAVCGDKTCRCAILKAPACIEALETLVGFLDCDDSALVSESLRIVANMCLEESVARAWDVAELHGPFSAFLGRQCNFAVASKRIDAALFDQLAIMLATLANVTTYRAITDLSVARTLVALYQVAVSHPTSCAVILQRILILFTRLEPSVKVLEYLEAGGVHNTVVPLLENPDTEASAVRLLALSTRTSDVFKAAITKGDAGRIGLVRILARSAATADNGGASDRVAVAANAALVVSHVSDDAKFVQSLVATSTMASLVELAKADKGTTVQKNAAIAASKLCVGNAKHRARLHELRGLEILNARYTM